MSTSTDASPSSVFSSFSTTPSLTTQTRIDPTPSSFPTGTGGGNGGSGNNGPPNNNNGGPTLATSAALYLYTFLATLVLLLSVSAAIVIRSFILRRRHRLMMEEAIRNGTWVPPSPPSRPARVDLSKKPVLWEAYIDNKGSISYLHGGGKSLKPDWMTEQTREWDMIRPISAAYLASSTDPTSPNSISTTVGELPPPSGASTTRSPRHRVVFSRAMQMLNPTPVETSPLPAANLSNVNINAGGSGAGDVHISMTELDEKKQGPSLMRVAVLIAMPSAPASSPSTVPSTDISLSASASTITSLPSPRMNPTTSATKLPTTINQSHPLKINPAFPLPLPPSHDEKFLLPPIEVGVAEVLVVPPDLDTQDQQIHEKKKLRGSVVSRDSVASEVG